jgi:hypothetical protein
MRRWLWLLLSLVLLLAVAAYFWLDPRSGEVREGSQLVVRVEAYRQAHGRLPESFEELGVTGVEADKFFYRKCDQQQFIIWFGTYLGESMTYDSSSTKWDRFNACPRPASSR